VKLVIEVSADGFTMDKIKTIAEDTNAMLVGGGIAIYIREITGSLREVNAPTPGKRYAITPLEDM
jgi:hypothetical protein